MIDKKLKQKELLEEHFNEIVKRIDEHKDSNTGFTLKELLDKEKDNYYYVYMTKGIVSSLIFFGYIEIFASYNGNKNFIYKSLKKIKDDVK